MKTKLQNSLLIFSLQIAVLACSKTETSDMMFKKAANPVSSAVTVPVPVPGQTNGSTPGSSDSMDNTPQPPTSSIQQDPPIVIANPDNTQSPPTVVNQQPPVVVTQNPPVPPVVVTQDPPVPPVVVTQDPPVPPVVVTQDPPVPPVVVTQDPPVPPVVVNQQPPVVVVQNPPQPEVYKPYPESEIPNCKLKIELNGMGSVAQLAIASASKDELMKMNFEGFENLSNAELIAMRTALDKMSSGGGVQVLKENDQFNKQQCDKNANILIVNHAKNAKELKLNGIGKGARVFILNVAQEHNTVCVRANGLTDSSQVATSVIGDQKFVSRADVDVNGSGAVRSFIKVAGGHQTGVKFMGNGMKESDLLIDASGGNDTFSSITANSIQKSFLSVKLKGKDDSGLGISANGITDSVLRFEIEGQKNVKAIMGVNGMSGNEVSGWLKYKSEGKVDASIADYIELMPLP